MRKVYYAHAMCLYGRVDERKQLALIRKKFRGSSVVNPADYDGDPLKRQDTVGFCLRLVEGCDMVVFSRLLGKITAGVGKEVNHALKIGKPVFELSPLKVVRRTRKVSYITRRDTIRLYMRYRERLWFV